MWRDSAAAEAPGYNVFGIYGGIESCVTFIKGCIWFTMCYQWVIISRAEKTRDCRVIQLEVGLVVLK